MSNIFHKLAIATTVTVLGTTVATSAQALDFSFSVEFYNEIDPTALSGTLAGSFAAPDSAFSDGTIIASEFTSFNSSWVGVNGDPDFANLSFDLNDLFSSSFFTAPDNYAFIVTDTILARGWRSSGTPLTLADTTLGYAASAGNVQTTYSAGPLEFQVIPTPALLPGLVGFGLSVWRKRKADA